MGKNLFLCGPPGCGEIAKLTNNHILGIQMIASSEGMAIGEKLGMDPKVLMQILSVSTGRNFCIDSYNPRPGNMENVPAARNYEGGFQVDLIKKDLGLALEAANSVGAQTEFGEAAFDTYDSVSKKGFGKKDYSFVFQYIMKNHQL